MKQYILVGHEPVVAKDISAWGQWFEKNDRHVADTATEFHRVSTVFLGIDHNFLSKGPPLLFETMVFETGVHLSELYNGEDIGYIPEELDCRRYATWDEAAAGHAEILAKVLRNEQKAKELISKTKFGVKHDH